MDSGALVTVTAAAVLYAALSSWLIGRFADPLGRVLGLLDFPDYDGGRKRHDRVTPLVGGIAVTGAAVVGALLTLASGELAGPVIALHLVWLSITVGAMFAIGLADDRFGLSPKLRLMAAVGMLLVVVVYAHDFSLPMVRFAGQDRLSLLGPAGDAFALLCLVGLLNAVNMADGKNGIVLGFGLIWSAVLLCRLPPAWWPLLGSTAAALGIMFVFNLRGRLFLGDGGSYAISALFGLLAIYAYNSDFASMRADDVAVLFAIPVFDTIRLMTVRTLSGRSPLEGDRDHLHHHLHRSMGWPRGLWVYLAMIALPNLGAVLLPGTGPAWLAVSLIAYMAVLRVARKRAGLLQERRLP